MNNTNDTSTVSNNNSDLEKNSWQLNALTEALGDLHLTVKDSLSVGRGSDNDVVLGSKQVSRNHALLSVFNGELYVKDLESSNGTFVNDNRIESNKTKLLSHDDTVAFATFAFKVAKETVPLTDFDNKQSVAEDASLVATTDASVTEPAYDSDDLTNIGAIDTGVIKNETASTATEVVDSEVIDSESVDSSAMSTAINDNDITDAEIIDAEPVIVENAEVETIDTHLAEEATPVVNVTDIKDDKVETINTSHAASTDASNPTITSPAEPIADEETVIEQAIVEEGVVNDNTHDAIVETIDSKQDTVEDTVKAPVEKQTIINDVLSATENVDREPSTTPVDAAPSMQKPVVTDSMTSEPIVQTLDKVPESMSQPVTPEHDKTTTTALQEEADPDVLRAKQAATSQFSGTANLGQSRDIGTEGNNALDQAISNPATHSDNRKKPSGSWFIWVFIAIIIIGLALWLFNKGAV